MDYFHSLLDAAKAQPVGALPADMLAVTANRQKKYVSTLRAHQFLLLASCARHTQGGSFANYERVKVKLCNCCTQGCQIACQVHGMLLYTACHLEQKACSYSWPHTEQTRQQRGHHT